MKSSASLWCQAAALLVVFPLSLGVGSRLFAQGAAAQAPAEPPPTPRAAAPIDLTGYWVSIVTEDWRWRMVPPAKGDYASIPISAAAKKIADGWDPEKDEKAGEQCKAYGAAGIMRVPARLRITWQDDSTLKVEIDAGTQTRLLHFGSWKPGQGKPGWQGDSVAEWELPGGRGARGRAAAGRAATGGRGREEQPQPKFGSLKVVTTNMRPGYLRKNGVPYGTTAVMTEYWDLHKGGSQDWLVITTLIDDPVYLQEQYVTSPNFRRERDGSKWEPTPCSARW